MNIGPERQLSAPHSYAVRCAGHLLTAMNSGSQLAVVISEVIHILSYHDFDAIAFRGLSGALIAPIVAMKMKKTLLAVRKPSEDTAHSMHTVEGDYGARRYVILDDFISSGTTVREIIRAIRREFADGNCPEPACIGICEYIYSYREGHALVPAPRMV